MKSGNITFPLDPVITAFTHHEIFALDSDESRSLDSYPKPTEVRVRAIIPNSPRAADICEYASMRRGAALRVSDRSASRLHLK